jgi:F0F1-type ATP synthase delta subunit
MNLPIISHIYSLEDRAYVLEKLSQLESGAFMVGKPFEEQVHESFSLPIAESLLKAASEANVSAGNGAGVQKFLSDLQAQIKALPVITLRLAITPSSDLLRDSSRWFESVLGEKTLVSYVIDPALLGGAAIEWNGSYLDFSLKKQLTERLKAVS